MNVNSLRTTTIAGIAVLGLGLSGCGGNEAGETTSTSTSTTTTTSTPVADSSASTGHDHGATTITTPSTSTSDGPLGTASPSARNPSAHNATDTMFNQMMIEHHQGAIDMSKLAATQASSPEVKKLAAQIQQAQAPEIATMSKKLAGWGEPLSSGHSGHSMPGMDMDGKTQDQVMQELKGLKGEAFDKAWLTNMIAHHEGAIVMAKDQIAQGQDDATKKLAARIQANQQPEIDQMKKLLASL